MVDTLLTLGERGVTVNHGSATDLPLTSGQTKVIETSPCFCHGFSAVVYPWLKEGFVVLCPVLSVSIKSPNNKCTEAMQGKLSFPFQYFSSGHSRYKEIFNCQFRAGN